MLGYQKIRMYRNTEDTEGKLVNLEYVVNRIRYGSTDTVVTFSGIFPPRQRSADAIESHTGLIALHLERLAVKTIPEFIKRLQQLSGVVLVFRPPREIAILSCVIHVDPVPRDPTEHATAFQAAKAHFNYLKHWHQFKINDRGSDCSDLSYLKRDFGYMNNYHTKPLTWNREPLPPISNSDEIEDLSPEDLTAEHSIQDFHRVLGGSYEHARQRWHKAGGKEYLKVQEAELADRIQELSDNGLSQRDIAETLKIKRYNVRKVLEKRRGRNCNIS